MHVTKSLAQQQTGRGRSSAGEAVVPTVHHWSLSADPRCADRRLDAVAAGFQRASAAPLWELEQSGAALPEVGDLLVLSDTRGRRRVLVEVVERTVLAFRDVDELFAADMGEGDLSLRHWRDVHADAFARSARSAGLTPSGSMPVLALRFELVDPARVAARGPAHRDESSAHRTGDCGGVA